jgi:hypothetical protein
MRRTTGMIAMLVMCMTILGVARGQNTAKKAAPAAKPIAALAWLVGGVWTADTTRPGSAASRIETRYQWADNGAYIRFNTHFISEKGTLRNYDGSFFWNPEQNSLEMWYTDATGTITHGPVKLDGDVMEMMFRAEGFDGKPGDFRCRVTRKTNDDYNWLLEAKQPEGWKQVLTLEYLRQPEA